MWDLSQNYRPAANVLMHIIIYSIVYKKKNVFVFISVALDFTFILVSELQLNWNKKRCYITTLALNSSPMSRHSIQSCDIAPNVVTSHLQKSDTKSAMLAMSRH